MFIKVKYSDDKELLANPNCYIKTLIDYIRSRVQQSKIDLLETQEIDLADDQGSLLFVNDHPPWTNGLDQGMFKLRATYVVVLIDRDDDGKISRVIPTARTVRAFSDIMSKLRNQMSITGKQRSSLTRVSSSHTKRRSSNTSSLT